MNYKKNLYLWIKHKLLLILKKPKTGTAVCYIFSFALFTHLSVLPIATWIEVVNGIDVQLEKLEFDFSQLTTILLSLLGMSSLRTFEKTKGVHSK